MRLSQGVRFECQQCGRCCRTRGEAGVVVLTGEDQVRLSRFLGLSEQGLLGSCAQRVGNTVVLRDGAPDGACILLEGGRCRAWQARPLQCRTWPFWPEHMTARAFEREVASFCPGAGRGRLWDAATVRAIARVQRRADQSSG